MKKAFRNQHLWTCVLISQNNPQIPISSNNCQKPLDKSCINTAIYMSTISKTKNTTIKKKTTQTLNHNYKCCLFTFLNPKSVRWLSQKYIHLYIWILQKNILYCIPSEQHIFFFFYLSWLITNSRNDTHGFTNKYIVWKNIHTITKKAKIYLGPLTGNSQNKQYIF